MKKILIIEDNEDMLDNTAEIIALAGYEVLRAANGKAGVELALSASPDLIVCDIMMPVLDGYGVFHLLSRNPLTSAIPFIFLTAKSEKADIRKGLVLGADDYIMKPFDGEDLLHAIEVRLNKANLLKGHYAGPEALVDFLQELRQTGKVQLTSEERDVYSFTKKQTIYTEGQRPRVLYFVISGKVKVWKENEEGKEFITSIHGPGAYFGYIAILEDQPYKEDAEALEDTELMLIPKADFLSILSTDLEIAQTFIRMIANNVETQEQSLLQMAYGSVRKKVAYGLIHVLDGYRTADKGLLEINLSREHLAQSIGIATESLVRTLSDFKDEGLVDVQPGKVIIMNEGKLRNLPY